MIKVIGAPSVSDIADMNPKFVNSASKFPTYKPKALSSLFSREMPDNLLDLLSKLLVFISL